MKVGGCVHETTIIPLGDIDTIDMFFRTDFRIVKIYDPEISSTTMPRTFSVMFLPQNNAYDRGHTHLIMFTRVWPLFEDGYYFFHRAPCAATI